jgi:pimeloyl-ACP methyl ester carboxylesterase
VHARRSGGRMRERFLETNGIKLHVVEDGPEDGPLVVLLHGFPEFSYGWRKQIGPLAEAGFRVIAPDQRGYNLSDKPKGAAAYNLDVLANDLIGLMDAMGRRTARVVGHDWGAAVIWWAANKFPERLEKIAVLNVPHHRVFMRALRENRRQRLRSWYMYYFQMPRIPELTLRAGRFAAMRGSLRRTSRPGTFTDEDLDRYVEAWSQPGALTAMLNCYRASFRHPPQKLSAYRISVPTLMIWGARDRMLGRELAAPSIELCDHGKLVMIDQATHWVQHEEPERVNALLIEHLR